MEEEQKTAEHKESVGKAVDGFFKRVSSGVYESPEKKREKAKKRVEDKQYDGFWAPELFPKDHQ